MVTHTAAQVSFMVSGAISTGEREEGAMPSDIQQQLEGLERRVGGHLTAQQFVAEWDKRENSLAVDPSSTIVSRLPA